MDYSKAIDGDKIDISTAVGVDILNNAAAHDYLEYTTNAGKAMLQVYNSSDHSPGNLVGTITFDNISDVGTLDNLLGQIDISHTT